MAYREPPSAGAIAAVRQMVNGYQITQAIHVLVRLGIPDQLVSGPRSAGELAAQGGAHEPSLYRVLRAIAATGLLNELPDRHFALTELSEALRSDIPGSVAGWAALVGRPYHWNVWGRLYEGVMTGKHPFWLEHGKGVWDYRQERPEEVAIFNRAMNSLTSGISPGVISAYDFTRVQTIVDVGGGGGLLLADILKANPGARGVLFDLPGTIADAQTFIVASGVGDRCELVSGDFYRVVPSGADVYLLKAILHDWYDEDAARILKTVRASARPDSTLLVIEHVVAGPNEGAAAKFGDLNMMVSAGGRERTHAEWEELLRDSGWRIADVRQAGPVAMLVAQPL